MRYLVGVLIAIGLVVLVIILIIKAIFGGGGGGSTKVLPKPLIDYANTGVTVQMTIDGAVSANQTHREIQIDVGQNQSYIDILQGYQNNVISNASYDNNSASYATFLRALDLAGYTLGNPNPNLADDRGYCPLGHRYIFEIIQGGQDLQRYWTTTCGGTSTFSGNLSIVQTLFIRQIPDYGKLTNNVDLNG